VSCAIVGTASTPFGFVFLDLHHVVDAAVEKGGGVAPPFALVVEPDQQRGAVDAAEQQPLGVVIVIGAGVAGDAPHDVGGAPSGTHRERQVLRHGEDGETAAHRFAGRLHDLEALPDERADHLADLHAGEAFGREMLLERAVDALDVGVDHARLRLGHGEPGLRAVDAETVGGGIHRGARPAVEHRILADRERQAAAEHFERSRIVHGG
jgi:hypothetical protein